jgi:hypothetical protein
MDSFGGLVGYSASWAPTFTPLDAVAPPDIPAVRMRRHMASILRRLAEYENARPGTRDRMIVKVRRRPYRRQSYAVISTYIAIGAMAAAFLFATRRLWYFPVDTAQFWILAAALAASVASAAKDLVTRGRGRRAAPPPIVLAEDRDGVAESGG